MKETKTKTCCFFGHRKTSGAEALRKSLYKIIENLIIYNNVEFFLFGSKSDFNKLCHETVTELREKYPHIRRIYVRAEYPYITDDYKSYILQNYEDTYYPEKVLNSGKAAYIERNYELIDNSDFCVIYYIEDYAPPIRKKSRKNLTHYQPKSGTKIAYEYARRKKKKIINTF